MAALGDSGTGVNGQIVSLSLTTTESQDVNGVLTYVPVAGPGFALQMPAEEAREYFPGDILQITITKV